MSACLPPAAQHPPRRLSSLVSRTQLAASLSSPLLSSLLTAASTHHAHTHAHHLPGLHLPHHPRGSNSTGHTLDHGALHLHDIVANVHFGGVRLRTEVRPRQHPLGGVPPLRTVVSPHPPPTRAHYTPPLTLQVRRATASPKWEGLAFEFPIGTWTEELEVTLHDASSNGRAERGSAKGGGGGGGGGALGTLHLRLLDLGDAPGKPYDAWHALRSDEKRVGITTDGKKGSMAVHGGWRNRGGSCGSFAHAVEMDGSSGSGASGEGNSKHGGGARATLHGGAGRPTTLSRADSVDVDMGSVRVCCEWQYASARPSSARGGPSSGRTGEEVGGAGAGAVVGIGLGIGGSAEFHGVLAEAQQIKQALKARIAAQDSHIDRLHGAFDSLRDEFVLGAPPWATLAPSGRLARSASDALSLTHTLTLSLSPHHAHAAKDFSTHCLHTLGELSVTVHPRGRSGRRARAIAGHHQHPRSHREAVAQISATGRPS